MKKFLPICRNPYFFAFNPLTGRFRELFRRSPADVPMWILSPDGAQINELRGNTIEVRSLTGQLEQTIQVKGWPYLRSIDRTADGEAFLLSHAGPTKVTIVRAGKDGKAQPIWEMRMQFGPSPLPLPMANTLRFGPSPRIATRGLSRIFSDGLDLFRPLRRIHIWAPPFWDRRTSSRQRSTANFLRSSTSRAVRSLWLK